MISYLFGFLGCAVAVVCFGSFVVPAAIAPAGDGIIFQWVEW
jgi:hypothetical protein